MRRLLRNGWWRPASPDSTCSTSTPAISSGCYRALAEADSLSAAELTARCGDRRTLRPGMAPPAGHRRHPHHQRRRRRRRPPVPPPARVCRGADRCRQPRLHGATRPRPGRRRPGAAPGTGRLPHRRRRRILRLRRAAPGLRRADQPAHVPQPARPAMVPPGPRPRRPAQRNPPASPTSAADQDGPASRSRRPTASPGSSASTSTRPPSAKPARTPPHPASPTGSPSTSPTQPTHS